MNLQTSSRTSRSMTTLPRRWHKTEAWAKDVTWLNGWASTWRFFQWDSEMLWKGSQQVTTYIARKKNTNWKKPERKVTSPSHMPWFLSVWLLMTRSVDVPKEHRGKTDSSPTVSTQRTISPVLTTGASGREQRMQRDPLTSWFPTGGSGFRGTQGCACDWTPNRFWTPNFCIFRLGSKVSVCFGQSSMPGSGYSKL